MWNECVLTAAYLINMLPSFVLNGKFPNEFVSTQTSDGSKDNITTLMGENIPSKSIIPYETAFLFTQDLPKNRSQVQPAVRRSSTQSKSPPKFNDYVIGSNVKYGLEKYVSYVNLNTSIYCLSHTLNKSYEPSTNYKAIKNTKWIEAINNEIEALNRNNTWSIYDLPKERKPVGSKWLFKIKYNSSDLGKLKYFLGIEVLDNANGICLSQRKYCLELFYDYGLLAAKHVDTHLPENTTLNHIESDNDKLISDIGNYQKLIGKLTYLTNTRPDISYVVFCLSQFMHAPLESHLDAALRVLRYLKVIYCR
ncbi:ribonuclease H-like domain-containing protein [Tanacetum coccineum]